MLPHHLANIEIQEYYKSEPKFNGVYSRNNLLKLKDGAIYFDDFNSIGTRLIVLHANKW